MASVHQLTCITCPVGCRLHLTAEGKEVLEVKGYRCKRGVKYAREEFTDPRRTLTTTVEVIDGVIPMLPVRTANSIPKDRTMEFMKELAKIKTQAPVKIGQVIADNILGLGIPVIACRNMERKF